MQNAATDSIFYAVTLPVFTAVTDAWLPILCCGKHSLHLLIVRSTQAGSQCSVFQTKFHIEIKLPVVAQ